jgi:hypothetical protein
MHVWRYELGHGSRRTCIYRGTRPYLGASTTIFAGEEALDPVLASDFPSLIDFNAAWK